LACGLKQGDRMKREYDFIDLPEVMDRLKEKLRLAVVFGGDKSREGAVINVTHNPRSWKSYEQVAGNIRDALQEVGFRHVEIFPDDITLLDNLQKHEIGMVWLNTGGVQGYNPTAHAAAMLEMAGVPYVGHNPLNSSILDSKHIFKFMLQNFSIRTAPFMVCSCSPFDRSGEQDTAELTAVFGSYTGPFVVKPISGRASLNVHVVHNVEELWKTVDEVYEITHNHVLIETYLGGREFCASVCGPVLKRNGGFERSSTPNAFSFIERMLEEDELIFTSMDKKAITEKRIRVMAGADDEEIMGNLTAMARKVYSRFALQTLVRVDFRADAAGNIYVLEANPKPDLKRPDEKVTSLTCCGLAANKMEYVDLVESLIGDRIDYLMGHRQSSLAHLDGIIDDVGRQG